MKSEIIIFFAILLRLSLFGQNNDFTALSGPELIHTIEKDYNVKFFYRYEWISSIETRNYNASLSLEEVLDKTFTKELGIKYHIYKGIYVILTKNEDIDLVSKKPNINLNEPENNLIINNRDEIVTHKIGIPGSKGKVFAIQGTISEIGAGSLLEGAEITANEGRIGTISDQNGNYKIFLPKGYHVLTFNYMGLKPTIRKVQLYSDGKLDVILEQKEILIEEVSIIGEKELKERQVIGYKQLKPIEINKVPAFMGETDVIKYSLLLPGIQSGGEMDLSFNVRGGKGDQNLILIDGIHTYTHSHFFGLFPGINPSSIENASLYKASIPIDYGGRLSSVYDIEIKKGSQEEFKFEGGISPVSGNISVSGPIIKNKLSFNTSYRTTYSNWVLDLADVNELERSSANFNDYNLKINYFPDKKTSLSIFFTKSYDDFNFNFENIYRFYNQIGSLNWKYFFNDNFYLDTKLGYTIYENSVVDSKYNEFASIKKHKIQDYKFNTKLIFDINEKNSLTPGLEIIYHSISPWKINPYGDESIILPVKYDVSKATEFTLFLGDKIKLHPKISIDAGVRLSIFANIGELEKFNYNNNIILEENINDTTFYKNGKIINPIIGPEYRFSLSYSLNKFQHINAAYDRNRQYIHVLTNTQTVSPVSTWALSNQYIPPQISDHYSLGYNIDILKGRLSGSAEVYYKKINNYKDFKDGSDFEINNHLETEIVNSVSKAYGIELVLKRNVGRISGWLSYTYSRALIKSDNTYNNNVVNEGKYYPANYDRPHNLSAVINMQPTRRITISNTINYNTGAPTTLPVSMMRIDNNNYLVYSERNEYRIPDYFRWDISITYIGSLKKDKLVSSSLTFSIYNLLGRNNVYSIYFENVDNEIQGNKLSIFGDPIPTITYKFKF